MWNSRRIITGRLLPLWFDALLKCETVQLRCCRSEFVLWFDALLKCETVHRIFPLGKRRCDLMLYWNVKQSSCVAVARSSCCDLMLYWNVKQCRTHATANKRAVIWCSIEMWNSKYYASRWFPVLWFDALLKCETVGVGVPIGALRCDLMLYWNVKQYPLAKRRDRVGCDLMLYWNVKQLEKARGQSCACCDLMLYWNVKQSRYQRLWRPYVVIWCSIEMWNSKKPPIGQRKDVVIWCSIEMWNSCRRPRSQPPRVVIWCSIEMWNSCWKA